MGQLLFNTTTSGVDCTSVCQLLVDKWFSVVCVVIPQHHQPCRCRCATCTTQCEPKWEFSKVSKLYVVLDKCRADYITRYSFSIITSGKTVTCRDVYALRKSRAWASNPGDLPAVLPAIHLSSQPHILPFIQSSIPESHIYSANSTKTRNFPLKKSLQDLKGYLTYPHANC